MGDGFEIAESLLRRAEKWQSYWDVTSRPVRNDQTGLTSPGAELVKILRCTSCAEEIFTHPQGVVEGTLAHMLTSHGYRMDGRQFDNQNNEVGHA